MKKIIVISLGGSLIIPDKVDYDYLKKLKKILLNHKQKYKFIIVCGGGSIARKYISALKKSGANKNFQSLSGISATRMNARFLSYLFGFDSKQGIPHTTKAVEDKLKNQNIVFCGALEYHPDQTSDATSAQIAEHFKAEFINLTNVNGLYNKDPKKHKNAKLIKEISWQDFDKMANKTKFKPGQHFVLDQTASKIISKNKIPTYILGNNVKELDNFLSEKRFIGTRIQG